jgi:hypothetical protein
MTLAIVSLCIVTASFSVISQVELENKKVKQLLEIYEKVIFV